MGENDRYGKTTAFEGGIKMSFLSRAGFARIQGAAVAGAGAA